MHANVIYLYIITHGNTISYTKIALELIDHLHVLMHMDTNEICHSFTILINRLLQLLSSLMFHT